MSVAESTRGRGRPPRLSREQIVAAARDLGLESITMQGVAAALGVDRKALNYHVTDRDSLMELVAMDTFAAEFGRTGLPADADWRELLRACGLAMRESFVRVGVLIPYMRFENVTDTRALKVVERVMAAFVAAGCDADEAARVITVVAGLAQTAARTALEHVDGHARPSDVLRVLATQPDEFPLLRQSATARSTRYQPGAQFDYELSLIVAGLQHRLTHG